MRFRLFLILIGIVILSLASGVGLRFALAWVEPSQPPPEGNVPAPINVGSNPQTKVGDLTIGGNFIVVGGEVIGNPNGGNQGAGSLNAEKICINGVCQTSWPIMVDAFVQNGNSFGTLATLGTNDNFDLAIETAGIEKMRITTDGNVGIGTASPLYRLVIRGDAVRAYLWATNGNPELDLGNGTTHWAIYRDTGTDQLRFWREDNRMIITSDGKIGIGTTSPTEKLTINGNLNFITGGKLDSTTVLGAGANDLFISVPDYLALKGNYRTLVGNIDIPNGLGTVSIMADAPINTIFISSAGNVGIGTISPAARLHIADPNSDTSPWSREGILLLRNTSGVNGAWTGIQNDSSGGVINSGIAFVSTDQTNHYGRIDFSVRGPSGWNGSVMSIYDGKVGIGTTSPSHKLVVAGVAPREYIWPSGGGNPEIDFGNVAGDNHWAIYRDLTSDELRFWRGENNVIMTAAGDLNSRRCFGSVYVGQTPLAYDGSRGGYDDANALCAAAFSGSHVCTTQEILETIDCNRSSLPTTGMAWILNGPPGYTARANDCRGWTSNTGSGSEIAYGAIWAFDANGGVGWVTTCNMSLKFACCK